MTMNWGKYLILGMACFMLFIVGMAVYMFAQTKDEYDRQYYEKGLNFDADYTRQKQVLTDKAQPKIALNNKSISIKFTSAAKGKLYFNRPSNGKLDQVLPFENTNDDPTLTIPLNKLATGPWHLRFEWESNHKQYLYEQEITIK